MHEDELHRQIAELVADHADRADAPPVAAIRRRGRLRRGRQASGAVLLIAAIAVGLVAVQGPQGRQVTPVPVVTQPPPPTATSITRIPATVTKVVPLNIQVHLGPAGFPDRLRFGMASDLFASDLAYEMRQCEGGAAQVRMWAQVLDKIWVLAAKEPLPGKNWICWSDGFSSPRGGGSFAGHGGSKNPLKLLQASRLSDTIAGNGELVVVGGPVTRQAVRLRILFPKGPAIDLEPVEVGPQFPVKFYAVSYLWSAKAAGGLERVVAYDRTGRKIAECWPDSQQGNVCVRPPGAPQPP
jgi:hypothetical protein